MSLLPLPYRFFGAHGRCDRLLSPRCARQVARAHHLGRGMESRRELLRDRLEGQDCLSSSARSATVVALTIAIATGQGLDAERGGLGASGDTQIRRGCNFRRVRLRRRQAVRTLRFIVPYFAHAQRGVDCTYLRSGSRTERSGSSHRRRKTWPPGRRTPCSALSACAHFSCA